MKHLRMFAVIILGLGLSACASVETTTRNEMVQPAVSFDVRNIRIIVPEDLEVSEKNYFLYHSADIVWRGDPLGDRHEQVKAIFETAIRRGVDEFDGGTVPANLVIEVTRFHALDDRARASIGGIHAVQFKMVLRNPTTGADYGQTRFIKADFQAFGGARARAAVQNGQTQKVRITDHLVEVIKKELAKPGGYTPLFTGFIGAVNQM